MVLHVCEKCDKEFDKKSNYLSHINRKTPCKKITLNYSKNTLKIQNDMIDNKTKFECIYCLKIFSRQFNLDKHIKNNCKIIKQKPKNIVSDKTNPEMTKMVEEIIKQNELLTEDIKKLKSNQKIIKQNELLIKENKKLKKNQKIINIKNQQINNVKNQINVNINVYDHGTEKLDLIDNKVILNAINKGIGISHITNIIESIYLNPELPKYQNICITDINRQKCMVFSKNQWILSDIEKIYNLISKVIEFSKEKYDEFVELYETNKNFRNKLEIFKKYLDFCDSEYLDDLNNDDITKENREKINRCKQLTEKLENEVIKLFYNSKVVVLKKSSNLIL